jgi:hypothetical protein
MNRQPIVISLSASIASGASVYASYFVKDVESTTDPIERAQ